MSRTPSDRRLAAQMHFILASLLPSICQQLSEQEGPITQPPPRNSAGDRFALPPQTLDNESCKASLH